jgi:hypothetical protein
MGCQVLVRVRGRELDDLRRVASSYAKRSGSDWSVEAAAIGSLFTFEVSNCGVQFRAHCDREGIWHGTVSKSG